MVVSAGAANSAKLLLASASDRHPDGLANGSGMVGRHYMFHNSVAVLAISKEPNPTMFQKTLGVNDFYFGMKGFDFPMGNIQMVGKSDGEMYKGEKPLQTKLAPMFSLTDVATHAVDFWLSTEDLPEPDNRVTLTRAGDVKLTYTPNNQEPKERLYHQLKSMLGHLGMHPDHLLPRTGYLKNEIPIAGVAHQAGTVRFGSDPATSVLDVNCKAHELDNLYVVDTSFFPSIGAVNPALTAIANSLRVGDHLLERLGAAASGREPVGVGPGHTLTHRTIVVRAHGESSGGRRRLWRRAGPGSGPRGLPGVQRDPDESRLLRPVEHGLRGPVPAAGRGGDPGGAVRGEPDPTRRDQARVPGRAGGRRPSRCRCWSPASSSSARDRSRTRCCSWRRPAWASASG